MLVNEQELKRHLAAEYELGEIDAVAPLLAGEPKRPDLFKIDSSGQSYALKLQSASKRESQFVLEARLLSWLKENDFALVPPVMHSRQGKPFAMLNEQCCMLTGFLPAQPLWDWREARWGASECRHGGEALAQLHNHLARLTMREINDWGYDVADAPPSLANKGRIGVGSVRPRIRDWLNQAIDGFCLRHQEQATSENSQSIAAGPGMSEAPDGKLCHTLLANRQDWMKLLEASESRLSQISESKRSVMIHGDFHPGNALWNNDRVTAIVDFENSHLEHPLYDVAYSMIMFAARWHRAVPFKPATATGYRIVGQSFARNLGSDFLSGYMNATQIVSEEDCLRLLKSYLQVAGSVILYWMLIEHQSKESYRNLIEFLVANLEEVGHLAGV